MLFHGKMGTLFTFQVRKQGANSFYYWSWHFEVITDNETVFFDKAITLKQGERKNEFFILSGICFDKELREKNDWIAVVFKAIKLISVLTGDETLQVIITSRPWLEKNQI